MGRHSHPRTTSRRPRHRALLAATLLVTALAIPAPANAAPAGGAAPAIHAGPPQTLAFHPDAPAPAVLRDAYTVTRAPQGGAPATGTPDRAGNQALGARLAADRGWTGGELDCLIRLWGKESGWNQYAHNASSGAYGIPQALPGKKMASAGPDWATNPATQIRWGLGYIAGRYGTPCGAWAHSQQAGWY